MIDVADEKARLGRWKEAVSCYTQASKHDHERAFGAWMSQLRAVHKSMQSMPIVSQTHQKLIDQAIDGDSAAIVALACVTP